MRTLLESKTAIIIPAYNEAKNIARVIQDSKISIPEADILVINDGSSDQTAQVASSAGAKVIRLPFNLGYGVALQTGFKYAIEKSYDYAVQMDADGQHEPKCMRDLLKVVQEGEADVAIGSRFLKANAYRTTLTRRLGMLLFGTIASLAIRQKVTDPTSGFQALNQDAMRFCASDAYPVDYPDADVIIMLHRAGLKIREVPVVMHQSTKKESMHRGLKPVYYIFKMCLSIFVTLLRRDRFMKED